MLDLPHLVFDGARNWGVLEDKSSLLEKVLKKAGEICIKPADYIVIEAMQYAGIIGKIVSSEPGMSNYVRKPKGYNHEIEETGILMGFREILG